MQLRIYFSLPYYCYFLLLICFGFSDLFAQQIIGTTRYDLQSNASMSRRVLNEGNGTIHAMWNIALQDNFSDRGTGYNQSVNNGASWDLPPANRVESIRTGWPNIGKTTSGRLFSVTHSNAGFHFAYRDQGDLTWTEQTIGANLGDPSGVWARAANSGNTIHVIISRVDGNFGSGISGGIRYFRSFDGGDVWDGPIDIQPGMADVFPAGGGDTYAIDAQGDQVAFVMGDFGEQVVLYKSNDAGTTWERTLVVPTTDPFLNSALKPVATSNGHYALIIDGTGKVHLWFNRFFVYREEDGFTTIGSLFILNDSAGLMYWNEDMSAAPPVLIGKTVRQDENGDGETTVDDGVINLQSYRFGPVSQPSAGIDALGNLYVAYSSMRDGAFQPASNGSRLFREVYLIKSTDGGATWQGPLNISNSTTTEDVFPHIARLVDTHVHLIYQKDELAGIHIEPDNGHEQITNNNIIYHHVPVADIIDPVTPDNTLPLIFNSSNNFVNNTITNCIPSFTTFFNGHVIDYPDGDITSQVMVQGVDVSQPNTDAGFWTFNVTDQAGNTRLDTLELGSNDENGNFVPDPVEVLEDVDPPIIFGEPFNAFHIDAVGDVFFTTFFDLFDTVDVLVNTSYNDLGAFTIDPPNSNFDAPEYGNTNECQPTLTVNSTINVTQLGTYTVTYEAVDVNGNTADPLQRIVRVITEDTTSPIIILNAHDNGGIDSVCIEARTVIGWEEPGFNAFDNVDGVINNEVVALIKDENGNVVNNIDIDEVGVYTITYRIADAAGNIGTSTRTVSIKDTQPPVISLTAPLTVEVPCGSTYNEQGYTALDNIDGSITTQVEVNFLALDFIPSLSIDAIPNCAGDYAVTYDVRDASGNQAAQIERTVLVTGDCSENCPIQLSTQIKVLLEGPYNTNTGLMNTHDSFAENTLPTQQPFNQAPWNYAGVETITNLSNFNNLTGWALIELRAVTDPSQVIAQKAAVVLTDGMIANTTGSKLLVFSQATVGNSAFFIVVHSRNHLAVMSASQVANNSSYDFTSNMNQALGQEQMKMLPNGQFALYAGDIDKSGVINVADFNVFIEQMGQSGYPNADLDFNGVVEINDFNLYQQNASRIGIALLR